MTSKKKPHEKRLGDRRQVDRRLRRRRLKKEPVPADRRTPSARRTKNQREGVRRQEDTYLAKIKEFKDLPKTGEPVLPPEEEIIPEGPESGDGFETSANEDASESTDPAPESESN